METKDPVTDNRPEWLRALTDKSWNLELIISGAAIFLANYLPGAVDDWFRYYLHNWVMDEDYTKISLPLLVYSFMKAIAWVLILTFVIHFVLRAFWAGVVGLHTVYKEGIRYENLPWQTDFSREQARKRFGALSDYILRLDRLCNQIFSVAFLIALTSLGICTAYVFIFLIINVLPAILGASAGKTLGAVFLILISGMAMLPGLMQWLMRNPRWAEKPWVQKLSAWAMNNMGYVLMPLVYRPLSYLNLTFTSQVPKKRLLIVLVVGMVGFVGAVLLNFSTTMLRLSGRMPFFHRDFFAQSRNKFTLTSGMYDNMRAPEQRLPPVSIPSEIVEGPFLRVFVDYPKLLDAALAKRCEHPVWPDSLPSAVRRLRTDSIHLACMDAFFQLKINDSLVVHPGWMFQEHPQKDSPGLVAYLPSAHFKAGRNDLKVLVPSSENPDSLRMYGELYFWYAPK